jgi:hypothetical protein
LRRPPPMSLLETNANLTKSRQLERIQLSRPLDSGRSSPECILVYGQRENRAGTEIRALRLRLRRDDERRIRQKCSRRRASKTNARHSHDSQSAPHLHAGFQASQSPATFAFPSHTRAREAVRDEKQTQKNFGCWTRCSAPSSTLCARRVAFASQRIACTNDVCMREARPSVW